MMHPKTRPLNSYPAFPKVQIVLVSNNHSQAFIGYLTTTNEYSVPKLKQLSFISNQKAYTTQFECTQSVGANQSY